MSGPSIHQLLGLPSDVTRPNAYQVFGLALGEADQQVIRAAIERRISNIKQAKSASDPDVWMQAVRAVQTAQKVLIDPEQKATLDAKYGILHEPEFHPPLTPSAPGRDPLAALLPGSNSTSDTPLGPTSMPQSPGNWQPGTTSLAPLSAASQPGRVQISDHRPVRRRRGSTGVLFRSIVVLMLGVIVAGLAYLTIRGGNIQLVKSDEGFQVNSGSKAARPAGSRLAAPQPSSPNRRGDGITKTPPSIRSPDAKPATNTPAKLLESNASDDGDNAIDASATNAPVGDPPATDPREIDATATEPPEVGEPETGSSGMDTEMASEATTESEPMSTSPTSQPSEPQPDQIAAADTALQTARHAIIAMDWANMKSLCEAAETTAVTDRQKQSATTLYQFADLAIHYRSAIQKAMSELAAGNEIQLTDSLTFLVQESSAQQITLYRNKREYTYSLENLPLSVAHALAPFGMNAASGEGQAAQAVFQAISPKTTAGHRAESIEILRGLESVPGADCQKLADFIATLAAP